MLNQLKSIFGERCTGIRVNEPSYNRFIFPERAMKFCEAVHMSFEQPVELTQTNVSCPGARRSFDFDENDEELVQMISENTRIPASHVLEALRDIPVINSDIQNILIGITEDLEKEIVPDVFIIYTQPDKVMKFIHDLARQKMKPHMPPYSIHSICGNVFARSFKDEEVTISFGCPESREYGGVKPDEVVVGLPYQAARKLVEGYKD